MYCLQRTVWTLLFVLVCNSCTRNTNFKLFLRREHMRLMDSIASGYSRPTETDIYEYRGDVIPIDIDALCQEGFYPASSDSDQLSLQGTSSSQQSSLPQSFCGSGSQQSFLTLSSQGGSVSAIFLCQSQSMTGVLWHRNMGFCVNLIAGGSHSICLLTGVMYVCFVAF
jgi:hypothetical protein